MPNDQSRPPERASVFAGENQLTTFWERPINYSALCIALGGLHLNRGDKDYSTWNINMRKGTEHYKKAKQQPSLTMTKTIRTYNVSLASSWIDSAGGLEEIEDLLRFCFVFEDRASDLRYSIRPDSFPLYRCFRAKRDHVFNIFHFPTGA